MRTTQKGFTLVEIAIVLVIIGLLLGGILKGQEMIVQARIKNVAAAAAVAWHRARAERGSMRALSRRSR
jgi:prepilin-type N-terminal cleavage/methylation domain-containing protein